MLDYKWCWRIYSLVIFQNRAGLLTFGAIVSHSMSDVEYLSPTEPVVVNNKAIET